jgi:cytochrome c-type biogenesis protein CcmH/NrfG
VDAKQVQGKITLGKFLAKNGQYDEAIATFRQGLQLDPSNAELQNQLAETIKACQAENKTLGENNKCGGP